VFKIYRNQEELRNSGIFNGGLDIGIDPMQLSVDFNIKENLADRLKSPYPASLSSLPPEAETSQPKPNISANMLDPQ